MFRPTATCLLMILSDQQVLCMHGGNCQETNSLCRWNFKICRLSVLFVFISSSFSVISNPIKIQEITRWNAISITEHIDKSLYSRIAKSVFAFSQVSPIPHPLDCFSPLGLTLPGWPNSNSDCIWWANVWCPGRYDRNSIEVFDWLIDLLINWLTDWLIYI